MRILPSDLSIKYCMNKCHDRCRCRQNDTNDTNYEFWSRISFVDILFLWKKTKYTKCWSMNELILWLITYTFHCAEQMVLHLNLLVRRLYFMGMILVILIYINIKQKHGIKKSTLKFNWRQEEIKVFTWLNMNAWIYEWILIEILKHINILMNLLHNYQTREILIDNVFF